MCGTDQPSICESLFPNVEAGVCPSSNGVWGAQGQPGICEWLSRSVV